MTGMCRDLFSLDGRVIVITGGLGQLGMEFARAVMERGGKVALLDLIDEKSADKRMAVFGNGLMVRYFRVDVSDAESVRSGLARIKREWGTPWGLVNNAGLDSPPDASAVDNGPFENFPESAWDRVMDVNLKGVFTCCKIIGGAMAEEGRGAIVNIASIYGVVSPDQRIYEYRRKRGEEFYKPVAYCVSKGALPNLTRYLATYWAGRNVRVNCLSFGGVFNEQDKEFLDAYCARVPMGRMAHPDEYNGAVVFLLSDASSYMTGSNIVIDGGLTAW
jgi:NAD(P)-dependent dehydrogenase (short-subunit alcohol dehydrogenase family)